MLNNYKQFLNREEAAELFGLSVRTLDKLTKAGEIPAFRVGRQVRYSIVAINNWVEIAQNKGTEQ